MLSDPCMGFIRHIDMFLGGRLSPADIHHELRTCWTIIVVGMLMLVATQILGCVCNSSSNEIQEPGVSLSRPQTQHDGGDEMSSMN
jgi:hypothetical protein